MDAAAPKYEYLRNVSIGFEQMTLIVATLAYYRSLPNWAQLTGQWLIRAAVATFILGQWSSVATYWYAMRYGARPPVEGVPFLELTVAVLGIALLALTVVILNILPAVWDAVSAVLASILYLSGPVSQRISQFCYRS
jgi:hypothetical protein